MIKTIFLKLPSGDIFNKIVLPWKDEDGNITLENIDVIGYIYTEGVYDEEGNVISPSIKKEGFHVNFLNEVPQPFKQYIIPRPETPSRVFAGDDPTLEI